jgi:hypothetical protein
MTHQLVTRRDCRIIVRTFVSVPETQCFSCNKLPERNPVQSLKSTKISFKTFFTIPFVIATISYSVCHLKALSLLRVRMEPIQVEYPLQASPQKYWIKLKSLRVANALAYRGPKASMTTKSRIKSAAGTCSIFSGNSVARAQCYKTFYVGNLQMFVISVCHWQAFSG